MQISVTKRHIRAAQQSEGRLTPIELAIMAQDCFEEVRLLGHETGRWRVDLDGNHIALDRVVKKHLNHYQAWLDMKPFKFDLPVEETAFDDQELMLDVFGEAAFGF
jgi:hypothetical protein